MRTTRFLSVSLSLLVLAAVAGSAGAQSATRSFSPTRKPFSNYQRPSAFSPYLELYRDSDGMSNYFTRVRPRLEQRRANQQQQRINERQRQAITSQRQALQNLTVQYRTQREIPLRPTGQFTNLPARSRFMNFGHYFGQR